MSRRLTRNLSLAAVLVAAALLVGVAPASAAILTNGDFETGTLEGWSTASQPEEQSGWFTYSREEAAMGGTLPPPPSGNFAAAGLTPPGATASSYLFQDFALPPNSTDQLSLHLYYRSGAPIAVPTPDTLFASEIENAQANQQVRVDVLKPNAPIESLSPNDILATVYASKTGDPTELAPTLLGADLSAFAGQTVRLRIATAVQGGGMLVGVDGVAVESAPLPPPPPSATVSPSNAFAVGKLAIDHKRGRAMLTVTVPDAGTLNVSDARRKVAIASRRSDTPEPPVLIRTDSVRTSGPQTVRMMIRPTAAARKRLAKGGKLPFRLQLTFTPDGGSAATQSYRGRLMRTLRPARR